MSAGGDARPSEPARDGRDELSVDPEAMRALGYRAVDRLVEHLRDPRAAPVLRRATREELEARIDRPPSEAGAPDGDALLQRLWDDVLPFMGRQDHPGYMAFIPGSGTWLGALGDFIAAATSTYAGSWMDGAGVTQLELTVLEWFRFWIGLPATGSGILVGGGSAANMTALACAREALLGPMEGHVVLYVGDQVHSSIARAARALGFRPDQVRVLPTDEGFRLSAASVAEAIAADRAAGRRPLAVVAAGGATNTGVVDPIGALAALCRREGLWLHVDAAYGGFAVLTERGRRELAGIELADSVTLDPHKWLFQPYECGALLVRDADTLRRAFEVAPDYLHDTSAGRREVNLSDRGFQLTRMARAIKIWLTIEYFGLAALRRTIDRAIDLAARAQRRIEQEPSLELLHGRSLSVVCFRRRVEGADEAELTRANTALVAELERGGKALVSSTRLHGRYAVRIAITNHTTMAEDVDHVLGVFALAHIPARPASPPAPGRPVEADARWLAALRPAVAGLRALAPLASLTFEQLERVADLAREEAVPAGAVIVRRWDASRDFYVVMQGALRVELDGRTLATKAAGEFFGELAALDWDAGFSYPRLATVVSTEPTRLLVMPPLLLNELVRDSPAFGDMIRAAVRERLPTVRRGS